MTQQELEEKLLALEIKLELLARWIQNIVDTLEGRLAKKGVTADNAAKLPQKPEGL